MRDLVELIRLSRHAVNGLYCDSGTRLQWATIANTQAAVRSSNQDGTDRCSLRSDELVEAPRALESCFGSSGRIRSLIARRSVRTMARVVQILRRPR